MPSSPSLVPQEMKHSQGLHAIKFHIQLPGVLIILFILAGHCIAANISYLDGRGVRGGWLCPVGEHDEKEKEGRKVRSKKDMQCLHDV